MKERLISFDRSVNCGGIDIRMGDKMLEEESSFRMLGLSITSKLDWSTYISLIAKTASKMISALFRVNENFSLPKWFYIFINLLLDLSWDIAAMFWLVLLNAIWTCLTNFKGASVGLLVLISWLLFSR